MSQALIGRAGGRVTGSRPYGGQRGDDHPSGGQDVAAAVNGRSNGSGVRR